MFTTSLSKIFLLICVTLIPIKVSAQVPFDIITEDPTPIDSTISELEKRISTQNGFINSVQYANDLRSLIGYYMIYAQYDKAESLLKTNLDNPTISSNESYKAGIYILLGNVYRYRVKYPTALTFYLNAYQILSAHQNWPLLLLCKIELAEFYRKAGKLEKARESIQESFTIKTTKKINDPYLELKLYNRAAAIENESRPPESSIPLSKKALTIARELNDRYYMAISLNELGFSYKHIQKTDTAIQCFKEAEILFWEIGAYREAIHTMNNRAMLYAHNGYPKNEIIELYTQIIDLVEKMKIDYPLEEVYKYTYLEYDQLGNTSKAYYYYQKYHDAIINAQANKLNSKIEEITELYENEKIQTELDNANLQLNETSIDLKRRQKENIRIYTLLIILFILLVFIIVLLLKLNKNNKALKRRNTEKDVFIQEIHHRVKNNLQFISSLINMQMKASSDNSEILSLNEASRRIRAMALVHEMLYKQDESTGVSIKLYLEELVHSLNDIINSESLKISFETNIVNKDLSITSSIALGMISSELISNSIKYAFKNTEHPAIYITLQESNISGECHFILKDNGCGLINNNSNNGKLGMRLIDIFSRQLKGDYKIYNDQGLIYELKFKAN